MKKIFCFLFIFTSLLGSGFAQTDTTVQENNKLDLLPTLRQVVYFGDFAEYPGLDVAFNSINLVNHSLQNIKDGELAISPLNLKKNNFFDHQEFRNTPSDNLREIMPNYDLNSRPLPSRPLF